MRIAFDEPLEEKDGQALLDLHTAPLLTRVIACFPKADNQPLNNVRRIILQHDGETSFHFYGTSTGEGKTFNAI